VAKPPLLTPGETAAVAYFGGRVKIASKLATRCEATAVNPDASRILTDALILSPIERAKLIDELLRSFDPPEDDAVVDAWKAEAESRIDAYETGRLSADSAEAVLTRINKR
jgi:putative addiction module component (TIGR02574 family)